MNLNRALIIGRVADKPEVKKLPSGGMVAQLSIATNYTYKNTKNEKVEKTTWHRCVAYGKLAETLGQWVDKGQVLFVEGRIDNRTWEKTDGTKGYSTEIIIESFNFGPKAQGKGSAPRAERPEETIENLGEEERSQASNFNDF